MNAYYCNYLPEGGGGGDRQKGAGHKVDLEALERHLAPSITSLAWSNKQNNKQQTTTAPLDCEVVSEKEQGREGGEGTGGKPEREATCSCQQGGQGAGTGRG